MRSIKEMLECKVHHGHSVQHRNPKMRPFICTERNGISIINVLQTRTFLDVTSTYLRMKVRPSTNILFVGTTFDSCDIIKESAQKCNSFYVDHRWLGGTLTNWQSVKKCLDVLKRLEAFDDLDSDGPNLLTKKEMASLNKRKQKLQKNFSGIKNMTRLPELIILIGQNHDFNVLAEAKKLNIPIITLADTDCDPTLPTFFIPANDDSVNSVKLILEELTDAILEGQGECVDQSPLPLNFTDRETFN